MVALANERLEQQMGWILRLASVEDAASFSEIYRPVVESSPASFEIEPPDRQEMAQRIRDILPAHPWVVLENSSGVVGYAYASRHRERPAYRWSVDASVYVHEKFHRRGIGRTLYTALFQILIAQGFANAFAGITLPNAGSVGLHEAMGFQPIGVYRNVGYKFGAWHDVGWWQLPLQTTVQHPTEPMTLAEVQRHPKWDEMLQAGLSCIGGVRKTKG